MTENEDIERGKIAEKKIFQDYLSLFGLLIRVSIFKYARAEFTGELERKEQSLYIISIYN